MSFQPNRNQQFARAKETVDLLKLAKIIVNKELIPCGTSLYEFEDKECPFCKAHDALRLYSESQSFHCYSCVVAGDVIDFASFFWECRLSAAADRLLAMRPSHDLTLEIDTREVEIAEPITPATERQFLLRNAAASYYSAKFNNSAIAQAYQTESRLHDLGTLAEFLVGFSDGRLTRHLEGLGYSREEAIDAGLTTPKGYDFLPSGSYIYPHFDREHNVCHFTFKNPDLRATWQPPKHSKLNNIMFFGEQTLARNGVVALVEGENDFLSLLEGGWTGPVLASIGQISRHQLAWLQSNLRDRQVVTFFDHDAAGFRYREKVAALGIRVTQFIPPAEGSDIDEFLKSGGNLNDLMTLAHQWRSPTAQPASGIPEAEDRSAICIKDLATDLQNAKMLVQKLAGSAKFVTETQVWATCDATGLWHFAQRGVVERMAKTVNTFWRSHAASETDLQLAAVLIKFAKYSESSAGISSMMRLAQTEPGVEASITDFDANPELFGLKDGVVDLTDFSFRTRAPQDLISKFANVSWQPDSRCPVWDSFINQACRQSDEQETLNFAGYLQRLAGSLILGETKRRPFHFVYGPPASGKSVFTTTLRGLLGDYARGLSSRSLMVNRNAGGDAAMPEIAALPGVRMCLIPEAGDENCFNDELLKAMTGGDPITARGLYKDPIEFICAAMLIFVGNSQPSSSTGGAAFMTRIRVIGFEHTVPEGQRDPNLIDKIQAESSGILNWIIEGARMLRENGWHQPEAVRAATERYQRTVDTFGVFLDECTSRSGSHTSKAELYREYQAWSKDNGYWPVKASRFSTRMGEAGFREVRPGGGARCWSGISINFSGNPMMRSLPQRHEEIDPAEAIPAYSL